MTFAQPAFADRGGPHRPGSSQSRRDGRGRGRLERGRVAIFALAINLHHFHFKGLGIGFEVAFTAWSLGGRAES